MLQLICKLIFNPSQAGTHFTMHDRVEPAPREPCLDLAGENNRPRTNRISRYLKLTRPSGHGVETLTVDTERVERMGRHKIAQHSLNFIYTEINQNL